MASFPTPFAGVSALYPLTSSKRYPTAIQKWTDATETRWRQSAGLQRLTLQLDQMTKTEKDSIMSFFATCKGSFDATWDITISGTLYDYMAFAADSLMPVEQAGGVWSLTIALVQTRKN